MFTLRPKRTLAVLDFDCECRPLSWYGGDWVTKEVTAISWAWIDPKHPRKAAGGITSVCLGEPHDPTPEAWADLNSPRWTVAEMLTAFLTEFNKADVVTGHYIRGFDLGLLNGALMENAMPLLRSTMAQDTKGDLARFSGLSKSQENLGGLLGLSHPKVGMNQQDWRDANRLTAEGVQRSRKRVVGDVAQHIEMRAVLLERGVLDKPLPWTGRDQAEGYTP